ncbi:hypothetical protein ANCDUO_05872 [Ancylostoma duodenale]|uniref:Peptidase aspartic putative domain-containing protein n=1 Tax=Ancylostoma duodenale TaxID=51022 RepID=A0A0C2GXM9_9BILA|nr:hypothetical protein ANCDUO_05872 [Ancylostoma duodenale]
MDNSTNEAEDPDPWERYWFLEGKGTEEFANSEREVQSLIDKRVLENFMRTVEKRDDGYYVRLPRKDDITDLSDNKAIAFRRLISVWNSLQKDPQLLEKYNGVFEEQLRQNIIEEVNETAPTVGQRVHYIPHQAVLTPSKTTTKLRIVFDASAHYKNSPSLNDAIHREPSSPFLLAATTHFHLDQYKKDTKLVAEIKENLYVDNLLLTADSTEEGIQIYKNTKRMFTDLKMNLREFASNEKKVTEVMDSGDKSSETSPKVLGIKWNNNSDIFEIACAVTTQNGVTERTVASAIASIYDPWVGCYR